MELLSSLHFRAEPDEFVWALTNLKDADCSIILKIKT